ncbi:hypothetical protein H0H93_007243 [Arthromyces matolae]|nr:hypothetical protein H0H93_007243 [Arthromyces matolae]
MAAASRPIPLRVSNKKAFIWDVDDIALVRSKHHICGVLSGTLPHLSQQNLFLGVPLALMPEEAVLLVENGLAVLVDDPTAHPQPNLQHLQAWDAENQAEIERQVTLLEVKGSKENPNSQAMSAEAQRKRQAREEKRAAKAKAKLMQDSGEPNNLAEMLSIEPTQTLSPPTRESKGTSVAYTVVIPTSSSELGWYNADSSCTFKTIADAKKAGIWDYPSNLQERARCGVFRSLWEQGYFMGVGIKFGGDYLVYPGWFPAVPRSIA